MASDSSGVTLKKIATLLGLNVGTVSRALNDSPLVRPETRDQVLKVAAELRYRPNKSARMLVKGTQSHRFVAILIPNLAHQFFFGLLRGIVAEMDRAACSLMVYHVGRDRESVFKRILDETPDGLLVVAEKLSDEERSALLRRRIPFVYVDYYSETDPCVFTDNRLGGMSAGRRLLEGGSKKPLYLGVTSDSQQQKLRIQGFKEALSVGGVPNVATRFTRMQEQASWAASVELIRSGECDGIFYFSDEMAYGGLRAIIETGVKIPIIGYDDLPISELMGLTTVHQDSERMGSESARGILEIIHDSGWGATAPAVHKSNNLHVSLVPKLIVRKT